VGVVVNGGRKSEPAEHFPAPSELGVPVQVFQDEPGNAFLEPLHDLGRIG